MMDQSLLPAGSDYNQVDTLVLLLFQDRFIRISHFYINGNLVQCQCNSLQSMAGIFLLRWVSDFFQGHPEAVSAVAGFVGGNGCLRGRITPLSSPGIFV
jgi:hypothetical protein